MHLGTINLNNRLRLLYGGQHYFPELIRAIDQAREEIFLETYIFYPDESGASVASALQRASLRGVRVYVITDWFGTGWRICRALREELGGAGILFREFNPWFCRGLARQHRKIALVDKQVAFVGGINILDDFRYDMSSRQKQLDTPRWDFAVRVEGPLLNLIHDDVSAFWERSGSMSFYERIKPYRLPRSTRKRALMKTALAGFITRDNLRNRRMIQRAYLRAMGRARHRILLATPYFSPGRRFRNALIAAANRGVEVTLLIGTGEFSWQDAVAKYFYPKLISSGINVYEYRKTQLHAKVAVIDDVWATVGSSNCDGLSLFINHEANIVVLDHTFAASLGTYILRGVAEAVLVRIQDFAHLRWHHRLFHRVAHMVYRFIMRTVTWGDYN
ncbi:MAG: phospholipase D-like domain-containing protein [Burkholderiaceae bacterium]|jgi:cardiolipin synthase|nr:phospholipase D-like domain-containing protein [Burkholderiaceae bacterium]